MGASSEDEVWSRQVEDEVKAKVCATAGIQVISWERIREAGVGDQEYADLLHTVGTGWEQWTDSIKEYRRFHEDLTVSDGVVLFKGRIVVPTVLRGDVMSSLHRAHQGSTSMGLRAGGSVWWPGISNDLLRLRDTCGRCIKNAPSQPAAPLRATPSPDYPFQQIAMDFFAHGGQNYLVVVDRYSGWPLVSRCSDSSSKELIRKLRGYFCSYGVPEEMSSDGASTYTSGDTQSFLRVWGVWF